MMLSIFSGVCWPYVCLLWRSVYLGLPPIFWLGCLCFLFFFFYLNCLYVLEVNSLTVTSFASIFSHSEGENIGRYFLVCLVYGVLCCAKSFKFNCGSAVKNSPPIQEMWVWSLGWEDPLEEKMATHSIILARKIPWTEEPGGLQSIGWQRNRHDWANELMCT